MISKESSHISVEDRDFSNPAKWSDERIAEAIELLENHHLPQKVEGSDSWKEVTSSLGQLRFERAAREEDLKAFNDELSKLLVSAQAD